MSEAQRLLLVTLSNIGDLVMTTPVLEALHGGFPDRRIDVVADRRSSELIAACPFLGDLFHKEKRAGPAERWRLLRMLRNRRYEVIVDLRGPLLPYLLRGRRRLSKPRYRDPQMHAVEHHFCALESLAGMPDRIPAPTVWLAPAAARRAAELLQSVAARRCLAIAPGANWPGKIWPAENYVELVRRLSDRFEAVCLLGGPDDRATAERISDAIALPCINLAGRTNLMEAAACLARTSHFVGNDSGLGHLSAALGVPTTTVFGPGHPERYRPWGEHASVAYAPGRDLGRLDPAAVAEVIDSQRSALAVDR